MTQKGRLVPVRNGVQYGVMETVTKHAKPKSTEVAEAEQSKLKSGFAIAAMALGGIAAAAATYFAVVRPWHRTWGATDQEGAAELPGDDLIPNARTITHAVTIEAPLHYVWPLLAELGRNEGGVYRLNWLENVLGTEEAKAESAGVHWQDLKVGDVLNIHTNYPPAPVVAMEPNHFIVLGLDLGTEKAASWSFVVQSFTTKDDEESVSGQDHTRLIVRFRETEKEGVAKVVDVASEPVQFIIERKMMLTIKKIAEDLVKEKIDALPA